MIAFSFFRSLARFKFLRHARRFLGVEMLHVALPP
jgi:hypothetical protein